MIQELHTLLKQKKISSVELTKAFLKRIETDPTNSYITVCAEEALSAARDADQSIDQAQSSLHGIPIALKDLICTKDIETTCASKILKGYKPPYDATVATRLKAARTPMLGKLNMDEFAMGGSNENSAYGVVKNPVDLTRVPGGSSGGSAAAVKANLAVATLGSDTGGSIRLPAAFTGIVGLKPTYGLVSRFGLVAFASSLDQLGPMAHSSEDVAHLLSAIAGYDPLDSTSHPNYAPGVDYAKAMHAASQQKWRIGVPKEYFSSGIQNSVADTVKQALDALQKQGHTLVDITLPHTQYSVAVYYIVAVSEASSNLSRFDGVRFGQRVGGDLSLTEMYKKTRALFGDEVQRRILLGTFALSAGYYDAYYNKACQVRALISRDFTEAFKNVDLIVGPVTQKTAFKLSEKSGTPLEMYLNDLLTIPANLSGLPAVSVPVGRDPQNLPIGMQFIGNYFDDAKVLAAAHSIENHFYAEPKVEVLS